MGTRRRARGRGGLDDPRPRAAAGGDGCADRGKDVRSDVTAAKLTGTLRLKNTSADQTVRLLEGKLRYIDVQGQPITLEDARTEPTLNFTVSIGAGK